MRIRVSELVLKALREAQSKGELPDAEVDDPAIERPNNVENGDFSCSLPLKLARAMRMNPLAIADKIAEGIPTDHALERVWTARPGFINFALSQTWLAQQVDVMIEAGNTFGRGNFGQDQRVQVEFVSVNPTGPLHVGHVRGAVIGSALANIMEAAGYDVQREYYVNDAGNQMELFYKTLHARYLQQFGHDAQIPEDGYQGDYMIDLAASIKEQEGERFLGLEPHESARQIGAIGLQRMVDNIRQRLGRMRVEYDEWFSEESLFDSGTYDSAIKIIQDGGYWEEREGAKWFTSSTLGEDKDNVIIRSNGSHTYFASDIAYHYDKFNNREFDRVINIWGADHQGHVNRMKTAVQALGFDPNRLEMMLYQMVSFKRGDELVRASKRAGNIITIDELVDEVGVDACRYFFQSRAAETQMEFDLELAKEQSNENPVFYIQYAHARTAQIFKLAEEREIEFADADLSLLTHEAELALIRKMMELPELVETMASTLEPHHLPHYAQELATAFHWFYQQCRVVSNVEGDEQLTKARLRLCQATKGVLANCLGLMSMSAPEHM
jgi:arginyl-tRNA synthetase